MERSGLAAKHEQTRECGITLYTDWYTLLGTCELQQSSHARADHVEWSHERRSLTFPRCAARKEGWKAVAR